MTSRFRSTDSLIVGVLFLGTLALYLQTRSFEFLGYDDPMYVSANWYIRSGWNWANFRWAITDTTSGNWHPLTYLTYLFLCGTFGAKPVVFHLANALLHSINVALLYAFLRRTTSLTWQSMIAAMFWGWHPQRAESVAWISELKDVLCGFFWLSCMLAYARYSDKRNARRYAAVAVLLILALLSKPMAVMLPGVLLLLDYWPLKAVWNRWRVIEKIPLVFLSLGACLVAIVTQNGRGSAGSMQDFPLGVRLQNALVSYGSYISKTVLPRGLSIFYPHPQSIGISIPALQWIGAGVVLIAISLVVTQQRRVRPYLFVGWLWFLGTLLPVIGLVQVGDQAMADRYSYLPSIGLVVALVWLVGEWVGRSRALRWMAGGAAAMVLSALLVSSAIQIRYWRDTKTIFGRANAVTERNYEARATLAYALFKSPGRSDDALELARSAVEICPARPYPHHVLAIILQERGVYHQAFAEYEAALKEEPFDAITRSDFGGLLVQMGRDEQAIAQFTRSIDLDPTQAEARHNLAIVLANHNHLDEAIAQWRLAIRYEPQDGVIQGWLAEALRVRGDRSGAVEHYRAAFAAGERNPTWESNYAWLIATDSASSDDELEQAVKASKDAADQTGKAPALDALAAALARMGRFDDAVSNAAAAANAADAEHQPKLAAEIRLRLNAYRLGHPYLSAPSTLPATP